jgi:hypothetical protein
MKTLLKKIQRIIDAIRGKNKPAIAKEWRTVVQTFPVSNNIWRFKTSNLSIPPGGGKNKDGGMEWIIARIEGQKYKRLLIMVMGGNRPPSRIYFQLEDGTSTFQNSLFKVPLMAEADWEVGFADSKLYIKLDNNIIWQERGPFSVDKVTMNGYITRESTGQWMI